MYRIGKKYTKLYLDTFSNSRCARPMRVSRLCVDSLVRSVHTCQPTRKHVHRNGALHGYFSISSCFWSFTRISLVTMLASTIHVGCLSAASSVPPLFIQCVSPVRMEGMSGCNVVGRDAYFHQLAQDTWSVSFGCAVWKFHTSQPNHHLDVQVVWLTCCTTLV